MRRTLNDLERERSSRRRRQRDLAIDVVLDRIDRKVERGGRQLGQFVRSWEINMPVEVTARTRVVSVRGGTVVVHVQDAPTRFEVDRALRSGAEDAIRKALPWTLTRITARIGPLYERGLEYLARSPDVDEKTAGDERRDASRRAQRRR